MEETPIKKSGKNLKNVLQNLKKYGMTVMH